MATKSIWGWGGVRFVYDTSDVTFLTSFVNLVFEPVKQVIELSDGTIYEKQRGWRARLSVDLLNYDTGDSDKVITLIGIINSSVTAQAGITIYPKYETPDLGQNWSGQFRLASSIGFDDVVKNMFAGQSAQLDFVGSVIIPTLPDNASDTELTYRTYDSASTADLRVYDSVDTDNIRKS